MSNKTQADAFHYRIAICCATCPAYIDNTAEYRGTTVVTQMENMKKGTCQRLKMPVDAISTCDKHPDWRKVHEGHKEDKKQ